MRYRPDIDGLRAIAILAVVACHAGVPGYRSGYVGVDVFFVISGFLITSLLLRERETTGRIDIAAFYARRVRRLLPALGLVLATTLIAGFFLLSPFQEQQDLATSAAAASFFSSNIYFGALRAGYFVELARYLPLVHTWSLGVEEQFYILWPLGLLALCTIAERAKAPRTVLVAGALGLAIAASLALCFFLIDRAERIAFFAFPARAWELGAGALLALVPIQPAVGRRAGGVAAALGAGLLACVIALYPATSTFSGAVTLIAVVATVMILAGATRSPHGWIARGLAARPLVAIGKVSYAWYLWHWPLLALVRMQAPGDISLTRDVLLVLGALVLAALTWRLIEQPVRQGKPGPFASTAGSLAAGGAIILATAALAGWLWLSAAHKLKNEPGLQAAQQAVAARITLKNGCDGLVSQFVRPKAYEACAMGKRSGPLVLVWGDSHATQLVPGLEPAANAQGFAVLPAVKPACTPTRTDARSLSGAERRCARFNRAVLATVPSLKADHRLAAVVIAARWDDGGGWAEDLSANVLRLRAQNLPVVLVLDVPDFGYSLPRCVARNGIEACRRTRAQVEAQHAHSIATLKAIAALDPGVRLWDPQDVLCAGGLCEISDAGGLFYSDAGHLTYAGSRRLGPALERELLWTIGPKSAQPR